MALVKPQGTVNWTPSESADVASYVLFQELESNGQPTYDSPHVDVGDVTSVTLPIEGLPPVEGTVIFAVAAKDGVGNLSDLTFAAPVLIDVTPPAAPADITFSRDF